MPPSVIRLFQFTALFVQSRLRGLWFNQSAYTIHFLTNGQALKLIRLSKIGDFIPVPYLGQHTDL